MSSLQQLLIAASLLTALGALAVLSLRLVAKKFPQPPYNLVDAIDALLPQTQCGQCGHPGCRPYAEAIARGAAFNRCPPGREHTVAALAELLHEPARPLAVDGELKPKAVAFIREAECIGCTKCIQACPVDAIVGATKLMHTVLMDECTGCDLCVEPCPVDCIEMRPLETGAQIITPPQAAHYKTRFTAHTIRLQREHAERETRRTARKQSLKNIKSQAIEPNTVLAANKQEQIQAAIARAKEKKAKGVKELREVAAHKEDRSNE